MDKFQEIRPYQDAEVKAVLASLLRDSDMIDSIARFYAPKLSRFLPFLARRLAKYTLAKQLRGVDSIRAIQHVIAKYMDKMIEETTTSLTHSGLENLNPDRSYVFICNHRDIAMDPAFVNYMLYHAGFETLQIAIGDNLLKKPFVSDLMRLNKSFIVKRSVKGRELLASSRLLSEYIHHCIETKNNVWIAQREGRAKDGIDRTDPALLKMLAIAHRKEPMRESLARLNIVPVTLSYQYDACDTLKAQELYIRAKEGDFQKDEGSDIRSIVTGMMGQKGAVHVAFGQELVLDTDDPEAIAARIDAQILANYRLQDINYLALQRLLAAGMLTDDECLHARRILENWQAKPSDLAAFEQRLDTVADELRGYWLRSYANSVLLKVGSD